MRLSYCRIYFNTVCNMKNTNNLTQIKLLQAKICFRIYTKWSLQCFSSCVWTIRLLGNFPVSQVACCRCTLLAGKSSISLAVSEEQMHFFPAISQNASNGFRKLYSRFFVFGSFSQNCERKAVQGFFFTFLTRQSGLYVLAGLYGVFMGKQNPVNNGT